MKPSGVLLCFLLLFTGCCSCRESLPAVRSLAWSTRSQVENLQKNVKYLENTQDNLENDIEDLQDGQPLIELREEECPKCEPLFEIAPIPMGPWPPEFPR